MPDVNSREAAIQLLKSVRPMTERLITLINELVEKHANKELEEGMLDFVSEAMACISGYMPPDPVQQRMVLLSLAYMVRKGSKSKTPKHSFIQAAHKALAALTNIPEAGGVLSAIQEDEHLEATMDLAQSIKQYQG